MDGRPVDTAIVRRMGDTLRHRGPDDEGIWSEDAVALASRRLAVIDLSPRGRQPIANEDGSILIVLNGEVYNFQEIRARLESRGHRFRSDTDTEAVVHLYEEDGIDCLQHLRGMFAFAIWDAPRRRLFLARDRLGKKPLFYAASKDSLVFASEIRALFQDPGVSREPDVEAIHHFLTFGYVPSPWSSFRAIRKLPPAHYLLVHDGDIAIHRYWSLAYEPRRQAAEAAVLEELESVLEDAVRLRLVSDVPLGALLSGGLDSSLVVALMRRFVTGRLETFSIGFEQPEYDELRYARQVADRFDTEHHELIVKPDAVAALPRLVWHYGEPFADSSALPSFALCEMARGFVTVALNGDGGDEVFLGYDRYRAGVVADWAATVPRPLRSGIAALARVLPGTGSRSWPARVRRFAEGLPMGGSRRYARWVALADEAAKARLYTDDFAKRTAGADSLALLDVAFAESAARSPVETMADVDVRLYLPDDLLVKMDIASMAHSLELRSPLLDHKVVEFAATLPASLKFRRLSQKYLLKRLMRGVLPAPVIRRRKAGFGVPIDHWFRHELLDMAGDLLLDRTARARGYFRPDAVRRLLDDHAGGRADHHLQLWSLLVLELWHRMFVDRECPSSAPDRP